MENKPPTASNEGSANKIVSLNKLDKILVPKTASVISGSFDPFNDYYKEALKWASQQARPLVVIVHTDKAVSIRRGLSKPTENQLKRAKNVAKLDFVDYVVISNKGAHDKKIIKSIKPKLLLFQMDNPDFLQGLFKVISQKFPEVEIRVSPIKKEISMSLVPSDFSPKDVDDPILKRVLDLAKSSEAPVGKISAVLVSEDKIIADASNSIGGEHAEKMILDNLKDKDLSNSSLYILIPPCPMCVESILASKIGKVFYLFNYGDKMGIEMLKKAGVFVKKVDL